MMTSTFTHGLELPMDGSRRESYLSYLLRLWRTSNSDQAVWRASLEDPMTGELRGFADLDKLFAFLRQQMSLGAQSSKSKGGDAESPPV